MKRGRLLRGHPSAPHPNSPLAKLILAEFAIDFAGRPEWAALPRMVRAAVAFAAERRSLQGLHIATLCSAAKVRGAFASAEWATLIAAGFVPLPRTARGEVVTLEWKAPSATASLDASDAR